MTRPGVQMASKWREEDEAVACTAMLSRGLRGAHCRDSSVYVLKIVLGTRTLLNRARGVFLILLQPCAHSDVSLL
jgi:hypothetical protein